MFFKQRPFSFLETCGNNFFNTGFCFSWHHRCVASTSSFSFLFNRIKHKATRMYEALVIALRPGGFKKIQFVQLLFRY